MDAEILRRLAAPAGLAGGELAVALILADAAILIGPIALGWLWVTGGGGDRRASATAALAGFLALGVAGFISSQIDRPRPFVVGLTQNYLDHPADSSLPSDHAALLFALSAGLALRGRAGTCVLLFVVGALVGGARVFLGAHDPTDILAGALVGLVAGVVVSRGPGVRLADGLTTLGERIYDAPVRALRRRFR
jgi:undecaprenyl-diphosphatase